jgi:hypothetical protein
MFLISFDPGDPGDLGAGFPNSQIPDFPYSVLFDLFDSFDMFLVSFDPGGPGELDARAPGKASDLFCRSLLNSVRS